MVRKLSWVFLSLLTVSLWKDFEALQMSESVLDWI